MLEQLHRQAIGVQYRRVQTLLESFVEAAPPFPGDEALAAALGEAMADLQDVILNGPQPGHSRSDPSLALQPLRRLSALQNPSIRVEAIAAAPATSCHPPFPPKISENDLKRNIGDI